MKEIPLTKGQTALVDDIDFQRLPPGKWYSSNGYAAKRIGGRKDGRIILLHRFVMNVLDNPTVQIDHINGVRADCRRANLRKCTHLENCRNKSGRTKNKYKCVSWDKKSQRWETYIGMNGKKIGLGYFDDQDEAARFYNIKAKQFFGEFAKFNDVVPMFPETNEPPKKIIHRNNTSGYRGVIRYGKGWAAQFESNRKTTLIKGFSTPEDAAMEYDIRAKELHGDRAKLNFKQPKK